MSFKTIKDPLSIITPIENGICFPEILSVMLENYEADIELFRKLVMSSKSSADLLARIRSGDIPGEQRMSLLKMFRRCVSLVCDTETTKKITKISTQSLVETYGHSFKPIEKLQLQFKSLSKETKAALAVLIGEYDTRGQQGYQLTEMFFDWFEKKFKDLTIEGPRRAGRDVELNTVFKDFIGSYASQILSDGTRQMTQTFSAKNAFGLEKTFDALCIISPNGKLSFHFAEQKRY